MHQIGFASATRSVGTRRVVCSAGRAPIKMAPRNRAPIQLWSRETVSHLPVCNSVELVHLLYETTEHFVPPPSLSWPIRPSSCHRGRLLGSSTFASASNHLMDGPAHFVERAQQPSVWWRPMNHCAIWLMSLSVSSELALGA